MANLFVRKSRFMQTHIIVANSIPEETKNVIALQVSRYGFSRWLEVCQFGRFSAGGLAQSGIHTLLATAAFPWEGMRRSSFEDGRFGLAATYRARRWECVYPLAGPVTGSG